MRERLYALASLVWVKSYKEVAEGHLAVIPMEGGVWILNSLWVKHLDVHHSVVEGWGARWSIPVWYVAEAVIDIIKTCSGKEPRSQEIKKIVEENKTICEEIRDVL